MATLDGGTDGAHFPFRGAPLPKTGIKYLFPGVIMVTDSINVCYRFGDEFTENASSSSTTWTGSRTKEPEGGRSNWRNQRTIRPMMTGTVPFGPRHRQRPRR